MSGSNDVAFIDVYPDGPIAPAPGVPPVSVVAADGNPDFPGMPAGAWPVNLDYLSTVPGTYDVWNPGPNYRFVLTNAFVVAAAAGRVALVDGTDVQGQRPVDGDFAANAGAAPNLVPVPYVSRSPGSVLRLVTTVTGNVRVHVAGWLRSA